jgi:hypothetical protein
MFLESAPIDIDYVRDTDWWSKVDCSDADGCWLWTQSTGSHGYGQTWDGVTVRLTHRVAWTLTNGPIPDGMTVDHRCRNRRCVNPAHLRLLPNVLNAHDNGNHRKSHCPLGHPYDPENTYVNPRGHRYCRACRARWKRKH